MQKDESERRVGLQRLDRLGDQCAAGGQTHDQYSHAGQSVGEGGEEPAHSRRRLGAPPMAGNLLKAQAEDSFGRSEIDDPALKSNHGGVSAVLGAEFG